MRLLVPIWAGLSLCSCKPIPDSKDSTQPRPGIKAGGTNVDQGHPAATQGTTESEIDVAAALADDSQELMGRLLRSGKWTSESLLDGIGSSNLGVDRKVKATQGVLFAILGREGGEQTLDLILKRLGPGAVRDSAIRTTFQYFGGFDNGVALAVAPAKFLKALRSLPYEEDRMAAGRAAPLLDISDVRRDLLPVLMMIKTPEQLADLDLPLMRCMKSHGRSMAEAGAPAAMREITEWLAVADEAFPGDEALRNEVRRNFLSHFAQTNPEATIRILQRNGAVGENADIMARAANQIIKDQGREGAEVVAAAWNASGQDSSARDACQRAYQAWFSNDLDAATEWLNGLEAGSQRDAVVEALVRHCVNVGEKEAARRWAETIQNPETHRKLASGIAE